MTMPYLSASVGMSLLLTGVAQAQPECATCHASIAATYAKTGMARSFSKTIPDTFVSPEPFYHKPSDTWHSMVNRDGQLLQRRWRVDPDGRQIFFRETTVDWIMGSGNHARSFLHQTSRGALVELPFAWYSEQGGTWAMSPGHDRAYTLRPRLIAYECMGCHNGYPAIPPSPDVSFAEPLYKDPLPQGIDCQRCHGPGASHVAKAASGNATAAEIRSAIVNPSRLSNERQMEVCLQCHLETTALPLPHSLVKVGRDPFSYRPGEPLGDHMVFFDHAPGSKYDNNFEIAHSAYRLRKSQCFLKSAGKMTCTTCHNPHEQANQDYNAVCASCHATKSAAHPPAVNCVACHMPKRQTQDVIHARMTDHWILKRPAKPVLDRSEIEENPYRGEVQPYYPSPLPNTPENALIVAIAKASQKTNLARDLPPLVAEIARQKPAHHEPYVELGQALVSSGKTPQAIAAFEEAKRRKPDSIIATISLADVLTQSGQTAKAILLLTGAINAAPDQPLLWYQLGLAEAKAGHILEAEGAMRKSLTLDPEVAEVHSALAGLLAAKGARREAENEFRKALEINPDLADALGSLGELVGIQGHFTDAIYYLRRAIQLTPKAAAPRIKCATALAALGNLDEARTQIDAAIRLDPKLPAAYFISGSILERQNQTDKALAQIETALRLKPDYVAAHLAAARLLNAKGQPAAAQRHLEKAR